MQAGVLKAFPAKSCNKVSFLGWRAHAFNAGKSLAQMPCKARHSRAVRKRPARTSQSFEFARASQSFEFASADESFPQPCVELPVPLR